MIDIIPHIVDMYGKRILLLHDFIEAQRIPPPHVAEAWVVNHKDRLKVKAFLRNVIHQEDMRIYLKPIYLDNAIQQHIKQDRRYIEKLSDGFWSDTDPLKLAMLCDQVDHFVRSHADRETNWATLNEKVLQYFFDFAYTRGKTLTPLRLHSSLTGYAYPRIDSFFIDKDDAYLNSRLILKRAHEQGFLKREYHDTQHLCKDCNSGFLNYHEICPKCSEHNLKATSLIHHYRCAYLGPETDFETAGKLSCPKCRMDLRNVGVDYDTPGKIFTCKSESCKHQFQEAPIQVCCVNCGTVQAPDELVIKKVYKYKLAERGIQKFIYQQELTYSQSFD